MEPGPEMDKAVAEAIDVAICPHWTIIHSGGLFGPQYGTTDDCPHEGDCVPEQLVPAYSTNDGVAVERLLPWLLKNKPHWFDGEDKLSLQIYEEGGRWFAYIGYFVSYEGYHPHPDVNNGRLIESGTFAEALSRLVLEVSNAISGQ